MPYAKKIRNRYDTIENPSVLACFEALAPERITNLLLKSGGAIGASASACIVIQAKPMYLGDRAIQLVRYDSESE